jgi:predicted RNA binding protein YcfA (HicA-like mRNA interferase family)
MPPVPSLRGERVVRALEKAGFTVARIAGSHRIMRHRDGRGTTVPAHHGRDAAKGTLRGILSDTGISRNLIRRVTSASSLMRHSCAA